MEKTPPSRSTKIFPFQGKPDHLFANQSYPRQFEFNEAVAQVFDDMVLRSIPLYEEVLASVCEWAARFYIPGTKLYDLGCSTGSTIFALAHHLTHTADMVGVDSSAAMIEQAESKLEPCRARHRIDLKCADVTKADLVDATMVVMNYTLQFIPVIKRGETLERIARGLRPGGILYLSEKVRASSSVFHETMTDIYEDFKHRNGYSRSEIALKKEALDNVLVPVTVDEQYRLLKDAGFSAIEVVLRWNNFYSLVAMK